MSLLVKAGKIAERVSLDELVANRFHARAIHTVDMTPEDVIASRRLNFSDDPFDVMIAATALRLECALITRDSVLTDARPCEIYWD